MQKMVNALAFHAHRLAFDANYLSPFCKRARENGINILGIDFLLFLKFQFTIYEIKYIRNHLE